MSNDAISYLQNKIQKENWHNLLIRLVESLSQNKRANISWTRTNN